MAVSALNNQVVQELLEDHFRSDVYRFEVIQDMLTFEVVPDLNVELLAFLRDSPMLRFNFLTTLCGMHYPDAPQDRQFAVVYHMHNWYDNIRIRVKVFLAGPEPSVKTVSHLYASANWQERETWDLIGIVFTGHPSLTRIEMPDDWVGHPQRKDYPLGGIPVEYHGAQIPPPDQRRSYS